MNGKHAFPLVASTVLLVVLAGCAPGPPEVGEPVEGRPDDGREWRCESLSDVGTDSLDGLGNSWTVDAGSMLSVHRTRIEGPDLHGLDTRADAEADALTSAATAALDLLEQRGVTYDSLKRASIVTEAVEAALRGEDAAFPRMKVLERGWDECVSVGLDSPADTTWLASVLVEYPIGLLRGDVNNVLWERERAAGEAEVLMSSAKEHLAAGRWHAGLLDAARAAEAVRGTGVGLEGVKDMSESVSRVAGASADARLLEALREATAATGSAAPLSASAVGSVVVVEAGAALDEVVRFRCTYEWNGQAVPAAGVPVRFDMRGASAVLDAEPLTDEAGMAVCRILAANGPPGEYELIVSLDTVAARAALAAATGPVDSDDAPSWVGAEYPSTHLAGRTVHLVSGTHAVSVCAAFGEQTDVDAAQVMAGFARRMERDGFRMDDCGPGVNVVVTGRLAVERRSDDGGGLIVVVLEGSVFDQRSALDLGSTKIAATRVVGPESTEEAVREAEVLALKEVGRLLAVYFGPRMLASRPQ